MRRMLRNAALVILVPAFILLSRAEDAPPRPVSAAEAETHITKRIEPVTPAIAKTLRVGGTVKLRIVISPLGDVASASVVSGHQMLAQAALEAIKKWKYKPFDDNGAAITVATEVEVQFPEGMSESESAVRNKFFPIEDECRKLLSLGQYSDAEVKCREAVKISNDLPKEAVLERSMSRGLLAHSIFLQGRVAESLPIYEEALALDKGYLDANDADLATDYANLARAYAKSGKPGKADELYAVSVSTFEAAIENLPAMKENYTGRLKHTLMEYAQVKQELGQNELAEQLRKKAAAL